MHYILIELENGEQAYQEVFAGSVVRITSSTGETISDQGMASRVIDDSPVQPEWALPDPEIQNPAELAPQPVTQLSKAQYMDRFTDDELAAIYTAAKSIVQVEVWLEKFKVAEFIDLSDPRNIAGLNALEASGLLAAGRALEILNA